MPLRRPANHSFSEAATHLHRYHVWPIHDTSTAAASKSSSGGNEAEDGNGDASSSTTQPRRPSMRPLDYRWDRSRGIICSGHNQRRTYASKPIKSSRPASTTAAVTPPTRGFGPPGAAKSPAPTRGLSPSSAAKAVESGWKGAGPYGAISGASFKQDKDSEKIERDLNDKIAGLQARIKERKNNDDAYESQISSLKKRIEELDIERSGVLRRMHAQVDDHRREMDEYRREVNLVLSQSTENKAFLNAFERKTQAPLLKQIHNLNEAARNEQRVIEDLREQHETTKRNAISHSRDLSIVIDKLKKEIQGPKTRKQEDRTDYTRYQSIFSDLNHKIFEVRDEMLFARRRVEEEKAFWQKSIQRFRTSDNLRLFLRSSKYAGTKKAIEEYMAEQAAHARTTVNWLRQLELQLVQDRSDVQPIAHDSRALTRYHQLDEHQNAYNSARLAQRLATSVQFQDLRKAYTEDIEHLRMLIIESPRTHEGDDETERMKIQMQELMDARRKVHRFLTFFGYLQDWQALKALQNDDIVEKAVWVDTIEAKQALDAAAEKFYDEIDDQPTQNTEEGTSRKRLREDVRAQRTVFDYLVAQVRQRHLLAYDLGKVSEEDQSRVEQTIKRQTELAKSAVYGSLAGLGFQKPSIRLQISTHKRGEVLISATETSSKPVLTIDTLRTGLSTKVSKKKRRVVLVKKRPSVWTKSSRRAKVGMKQKLVASEKRILIQPSPARPKPHFASAIGDKAKDKESVSSVGISGLNPTRPRQAQWRRPAYGTEADTSQAESRAQRSDNMGFRTVEAALGRSGGGPTDDSITQPTTIVNDLGTPASEDGASAFNESSSDTLSKAEDAVPEEPQTILAYQIPPKDYRDAVMASPNSNAAYWSHNLYKNAENQKPIVYYCQSYEATEARAKLFLNESVLGFDMEWESRATSKGNKPDVKRNVSLIQIAAEDKIGLFQLARFRTAKTAEEHMPPSLRKLLESADIVKAGVNISGDSTRLKKHVGVEMKGIFELSHMFRVVKESKTFPVSFKQVSLMQQVQEVLHLPLKKDDVRVSAWSKELNTQQTSYAASDAYAGFQLFHRLDNLRKSMVPKPPRPAFYETWQPLVLGDGRMVLRSSDPNSRKRTIVKKGNEVVEEEEEEEEFFDAPEDIDTYDLGAEPVISGSIPNPDDSDLLDQTTDSGSNSTKQEISYPVLPSLDRATESVADDVSKTPARTITLPLRAKLTSKNVSPPTAPINSPEEEGIQSDHPGLQPRPGPLPCPEVQAAETWIITNRAKHSGIGTPTLRAYHLWHHQKFELREVASFCRDPPLAITTVASYIMQALKEAELPFDGERVKGVLGVLPGSVHGRYRGVLERGGRLA